MVARRREQLDAEYDLLSSGHPEFANTCARDRWRVLRTLVGSRTYHVTVDGQRAIALVPFADLLNHEPEPAVWWGFDAAEDAFCMRTKRKIARGQEVTDSYGTKTPAKRMLYFGF